MARPRSVSARIQLLGLRLFAGPAVIDAAKGWLYKPAWGRPFSKLLTEGMRSTSPAWSVGERELIAAFTSKLNTCSYCVGTHVAVATTKLGREVTDAVLADWRTAPIDARLRAMLGFIEKMTLNPDDLTGGDGAALAAAGVDRQAALEAIQICWAFNIGNRQADAYDVHVATPDEFSRATRFLLRSGYRIY
jgi:uncharacterized peroxidase-related enzyme